MMHSPVVLYKQEGNLNVWLRSLLKRFFCEWVVVLVWYYSAGLWSLARPPLCYYSCCCCLKGPLNTIGKIWEKLRGSSRRKVSHGAAVQTFAQTLLLLPCMVCVCFACLWLLYQRIDDQNQWDMEISSDYYTGYTHTFFSYLN